MKTRLLLLVCLVFAACTKKGRASDEAKKPLEIELLADKLKLVGEEGEGKTMGSGTEWVLHLERLPYGTRYEVGGTKGEIKDRDDAFVRIDVRDQLAGLTLEQLEKFQPDFVLRLDVDGRKGETKLPPANMKYGLGDTLKKVENGPVLFGTEPDDPQKTDSMVWAKMDPQVFGRAGKLFELDWIAVDHQLPTVKGSKTCTGYVDNDKKPMPDFTLRLKETEVVIYDRRTGAVVDKTVLPPDEACPTFTFRSGESKEEDSSTPHGEIEAWLRTKIVR
jgi:hypothetical protein